MCSCVCACYVKCLVCGLFVISRVLLYGLLLYGSCDVWCDCVFVFALCVTVCVCSVCGLLCGVVRFGVRVPVCVCVVVCELVWFK